MRDDEIGHRRYITKIDHPLMKPIQRLIADHCQDGRVVPAERRLTRRRLCAMRFDHRMKPRPPDLVGVA